MTYTVGKPVAVPETIVGEKDDAGVYLALETRVKLLIRCPDGSEAGNEVDAEGFEPALRRAVAEALHGTESGVFRVETACVQEFVDGGR